VHLAFDIFQGLGMAAAVGIRPFLPALVVGGLAAAGIQISFAHTDLSFLQSAPFLLALALMAIGLALAERRFGRGWLASRAGMVGLGAAAVVLGALLFAGSLSRGHYAAWPGLIGGVVCALIGIFATRPLFARAGARLDRSTAAALSLYEEAAAVLTAAVSVLVPPAGLVTVALLVWVLVAGRRREGRKYAGLRILR